MKIISIIFYKSLRTLIVISFAFLISCSSIVKTINGEKKPKLETSKSLVEFAYQQELNIDFNKNLFLKNKLSQTKLADSNLVYVNKDSLIIPYGLMLFDENWNGLSYSNLEACLIDEVNSDSLYDIISTKDNAIKSKLNLIEFKNSFITDEGKTIFPFEKNNRPIAIVLWAKYKGNNWAEETNVIIKSLENSKENYDVFFLNLDPNDFYSQY